MNLIGSMHIIKIKLPFGLNENNVLVHIANVVKDERCKYVCPGCLSPLIAAKANKIQHHFKHALGDECERGLESAIHLAAKQQIMEKKKITLPEYVCIASATDSRGREHTEREVCISAVKVITFDSVQEEKALHGMIADILAKKNSNPLIIEIFYRHKVDAQKIEKIKYANISAIEIDLSELKPEDLKDLEAFWSYINDPQHIQWLHNAKAHANVYPRLVKRLPVKINKIEKEYKILEQQEKSYFAQDLKRLNIFRSKKHIEHLKLKAKHHPVWELHGKQLQLSLDDMPNFLNLEVPNGDWIFGCDRRVWQTAAYNAFIYRSDAQFFYAWRVNNYLKLMCNVPRNIEGIERCSRLYPEVIPADFSDNLPSPLETLLAYFTRLCELGMLEFSGGGSSQMGNIEFKVINKAPDAAQYK